MVFIKELKASLNTQEDFIVTITITLIDSAMINLIKTQKNTDGEYLEEMKTFKWIDLTPNTQ